ncbi:MAG: cation:proton antiporter [Nitrospinota bacterium]|nr:cation:proton antiporter [Nitrospinota bacterium]
MNHASLVDEMVGGVVALLLIAAGVSVLARRIRLPFSIALVLTGMALTWVAGKNPYAATAVAALHVSPEMILYVFLPTLVFEAAFNLDWRLLRADLPSVLLLAAPGLVLSTAVIGLVVSVTTSIPFTQALLLGAILSATDPVAVIALFRQLGVSRRLSTLVEGESLFNDATAIVLSRILVGIIAAGSFTFDNALGGMVDFAWIFFGGVLVGWILAALARMALGAVESDSAIEITLTTTLAYLSFLVAEEAFHVSGVMATVAAGLSLGGKGRMRISPSVRKYLDSFWEYLAFVANALIFLLVGLHVNLGSIIGLLDQLAWVAVAMLLSRALVIFGLVPLAGKWPGAEPVNIKYQSVMYWGGLRGAIALAIVLSLPQFERSELFVNLVTGAVLFTLLFQGLTMKRLVRMLGLDKPPLADRFASIEGGLMAAQRAGERIPELSNSGLFSRAIARRLEAELQEEVALYHQSLVQLRSGELDHQHEKNLLLMFGFTEEKALYMDLLGRGHLSETAYNEMALTLDLQMDAIRHHSDFSKVDYHHLRRRQWAKRVVSAMDKLDLLAPFTHHLHLARIAHDYEVSWGRLQGSSLVLKQLGDYTDLRSFSTEVLEEVRALYQQWRAGAMKRLDEQAEQIPEFVNAMQERLGRRLSLLTKIEAIREQEAKGSLPRGVAEEALSGFRMALSLLRGIKTEELEVTPMDLLRKVPFFQGFGEAEFETLAHRMISRMFAVREDIIRQGDSASSMYFIVRGVVRVSQGEGEERRDLATLMAGGFFGELALLQEKPRIATVWAVTPCSLLELKRGDLFEAMEAHPEIRANIERAAALRLKESL